jgi:hypothetical protein
VTGTPGVTPTLVVLAAGVGRRYGGLKQLVPVGPGDEAILDYTIHDAGAAGFGRVILVIREETEAEFRRHLGRGPAGHVDVTLVHQKLSELPAGFQAPPERARPWGTGHAVLAAASALGDAPFAVANADDLYGPEAWSTLAKALAEAGAGDARPGDVSATWHMIGFRLGNTLPASGPVSRALCRQAEPGWLSGLDEILEFRREGEGGAWRDDSGILRTAPAHSLVSMNLWGFTRDLIPILEESFLEFLGSGPGPNAEHLLPAVVGDAIESGRARVRVLPSSSPWCGITSPEDLVIVRAKLAAMVREGRYPENLWA